MKRTIIEQLKAWKESLYRKPLILSGARQVGKTYILQEFGKQEYDHLPTSTVMETLRLPTYLQKIMI